MSVKTSESGENRLLGYLESTEKLGELMIDHTGALFFRIINDNGSATDEALEEYDGDARVTRNPSETECRIYEKDSRGELVERIYPMPVVRAMTLGAKALEYNRLYQEV